MKCRICVKKSSLCAMRTKLCAMRTYIWDVFRTFVHKNSTIHFYYKPKQRIKTEI
jgi:hypothetical protein